MDNTEVTDALKLKELIEMGTFDRLLEKVQGKLSKDIFNTEEKEVKQRNDIYFTSQALKAFRKEALSLVNNYTAKQAVK